MGIDWICMSRICVNCGAGDVSESGSTDWSQFEVVAQMSWRASYLQLLLVD